MNIHTDKYVKYFVKHVNLLIKAKIIPIVVFDGKSLP